MTETSPNLTGNPLVDYGELPDFGAIEPHHVEPAIRHVLEHERRTLGRLEGETSPTVDWIMALENVQENVHRVWSPVSHLNAVVSTPALRDAFNASLTLISEFHTDLGQNAGLYRAFLELEKTVAPGLEALRQLVSQNLRDFRLSGVALERPAKDRFRALMLKLAASQATFEQNLMDSTDAFSFHTTDRGRLEGVPEITLEHARAAAAAKGLEGWVLRLDPPTYQAVVTHADSRDLREHYYRAWVTRASDQAEHAERWNNGPVIDEILALRHESARLLGFGSYAELSLATKMAESTAEVLHFLEDLARRSRDVAAAELAEIAEFADAKLEPWDVAYYAEKLRQDRLGLAEEALRPYFPLPRVLEGLFELASRLFGLSITPRDGQSLWHDSVAYYRIHAADGREIGGLLTDLFARANKRGGAWMDGCVNRARLGARRQNPIAHLVCNFTPPVGGSPSLLTHSDVVTLFHEFGHTLHHLLTEVDYPSIAGINGVAWDAVELPSQFLENYAWRPEVLERIAAHYRSQEPLPGEKIATLIRSRTFLAALAMVRQLEFALFDFKLHSQPEAARGETVERMLAEVRQAVAVIEPPAYNRFASSFSHIFGGGYAAGYYSYKWAEVLAADAFAAFEEHGVFDAGTAARFRESILAVGGSRDALQAFVDFRGRAPALEPLLRLSGIES